MSRRMILVIAAVVIAAAGFFGYKYWRDTQNALPPGIASGNGRVQANLVDIAPKESLRVKEISFKEGDLVKPGDVVVQMDTNTLQSQLEEAKLSVAATREKEAVAEATIVRSKAQVDLAQTEVDRAKNLVEQKAGSQRELDVRTTALATTTAAVQEEEAKLSTVQQEVKVAEAKAATVQTRIDDATLRSPVTGRVLYRLAQAGEVLAAGGKAMTLVDLGDVYMEIFLPSADATRLRLGADARITVDPAPGRSIAATVSFVSPEAQFTPKQVETQSEREKLMFRVKLQVPNETVTSFLEYIKTGVRGVGYVKVDQSAQWPAWLQNTVSAPQGNDAAAEVKK